MRIFKASVALLVAVVALATPATATGELQNGDFENWPSGSVHPSWTGAYSGTVANQFVREITIVHTAGGTSQKTRSPGTVGAWTHVYQGIDTTVGDALTMKGWLYSLSAAQYTTPQIGTNTSTARPSTWLYSLTSFTKLTWIATGAIAWNATGASTYVFLESKRGTNSGDTSIYWDDFSLYHAWVPAAPIISNPTANSLDVDVDPGSNSGNASAEYAITIGGGAYTLGTDWLQAGGTVGAAAAWQTDALWDNGTVTGLGAGITYAFQVKARYNTTYLQETYLGAGADGTPVPEPSSFIALLGGLPMIGFAVRRRKA